MIHVEQWAEIRRMHFVEHLAIKEIARRTGRDRKTIRKAIRADEPQAYRRPPVACTLDPHRDQTARLLRDVEGVTKAVPEWDTRPSPSAETSTVNERPSRCTFKVRPPRSEAGALTLVQDPG